MRFWYMVAWVISFLLVACDKEEVAGGADKGLPASLTVSVSAGDLSVESRALVDPNVKVDEWTAMERAIDGREMYRLTVFLVDREHRLVAYRDLYKSSPDVDETNGFWTGVSVGRNLTVGTQAKVTFNFKDPMHGKVEQLVQGEYLLIAVANYSAYEDPAYVAAPNYKGLKNGDFTSLVGHIIQQFDATLGLTDFGFGNSTSTSDAYKFFHYDLDAGADFVCPLQPQPLVLTQKVSLRPGENFLKAQLKRTYARIRINLSNNSDKLLFNNGFSFGGKFAKRYTYLFENPDDADFVYKYKGASLGQPDITSEDAIIAYQPSLMEGQSTQVLFDGYVLESKGDAANYTYTLDVGYKGFFDPLTTTPIVDMASLDDWIEKNKQNPMDFFLIENVYYKGYYLYADDQSNRVVPGTIDAQERACLMWTIRKKNGMYSLQSYYKDYMGELNAGSVVPLSKNPVWHSLAVHTVSGFFKNTTGITVDDNSQNYLYLSSSWGSQSVGVRKNNEDESVLFRMIPYRFYPFDGTEVSYTKPIQLQTIDPVTSQVSNVTNIKRNDFINIYINSSYSDANGIFNFEVLPWDTKDAEIEYH